ncbi:hypothetical protein OROMI_026065 [Orobanche minor]
MLQIYSNMVLQDQEGMDLYLLQLINLLQVAERHNEVLVSNNARLVGIKKVLEANYGKAKGGKNPNVQGTAHGNPKPQRGKGHSGRGRGGSSNIMRRLGAPGSSSQGNHKASTPMLLQKSELAMNRAIDVEMLDIGTRTDMQISNSQHITRNIESPKNGKLTIWRNMI